MRNTFVVIAAAAGVMSLAVVAACVGDDPTTPVSPAADGGSSGSTPTNDAGAKDAASGNAGSFCSTVPPAASAKETVFCEDFEGDYASRWQTLSTDGTLSIADVGGYKALDVTLSVNSADDYLGPRLLWKKIPAGGSAEVSFDFMLLEAPPKPASGDGFLWFSRIGTLDHAGVGFGAELSSASLDYGPIVSTGATDVNDTPVTFAPNMWVPVTMRYATTADGSSQLVHVGSNDEYSSTLSGPDLDLLADDIVFLGIFVKGVPATARARFAKVVIRTTAP